MGARRVERGLAHISEYLPGAIGTTVKGAVDSGKLPPGTTPKDVIEEARVQLQVNRGSGGNNGSGGQNRR